MTSTYACGRLPAGVGAHPERVQRGREKDGEQRTEEFPTALCGLCGQHDYIVDMVALADRADYVCGDVEGCAARAAKEAK